MNDDFVPFEMLGEDAWELAEMFEHIGGWLAGQRTAAVAESLDHHSPGYGIDDLRADLAQPRQGRCGGRGGQVPANRRPANCMVIRAL